MRLIKIKYEWIVVDNWRLCTKYDNIDEIECAKERDRDRDRETESRPEGHGRVRSHPSMRQQHFGRTSILLRQQVWALSCLNGFGRSVVVCDSLLLLRSQLRLQVCRHFHFFTAWLSTSQTMQDYEITNSNSSVMSPRRHAQSPSREFPAINT